MARYEVVVSARAERDVRDIVRYIAVELGQLDNAAVVVDEIDRAVADLASLPNRFRHVDSAYFAARGYRRMIVGQYIVFFTVAEAAHVVHVERILHARRDWEPLLKP